MRSGGCTIQQALTPEAAGVVNQAAALARRRGHAQLTPLHVAHTLLSATSGLLRAACLQSHSHPLQCRALELCFNVALSRLPTATSIPILVAHSHQPAISNALVATFKRAQAQQRRGSIENQQQPILAVKIELHQLIVSILDDPSVSRVMREAGFSSTLVKSKVEQSLSAINLTSQAQHLKDSSDQTLALKPAKPRPTDQLIRDEDIATVIGGLISKRTKRSTVIVGECVSTIEGVVRGLMNKVEKGEVPEALRDVKFLPFYLYSFGHLYSEEVDRRIGDLKGSVKGFLDDNKGVILYLGDLKWISDQFRVSGEGDDLQQRRSCINYGPIEHVVLELGRFLSGFGDGERLWLLGIGTFQTYLKCKTGELNSLESILGLHAVTIPADSLGLRLIPDSDLQIPLKPSKRDGGGPSWLLVDAGGCGEEKGGAGAELDVEERSWKRIITCNSDSIALTLPSWLQLYKDEQDPIPVKDLCKKWSSICNSVPNLQPHEPSEKALRFSSPTLEFSCDRTRAMTDPNDSGVRRPASTTSFQDQKQAALLLCLSNPNSTPNSTSSSDVMEIEGAKGFNDYNPESLKILCNALEEKAPWQREIIHEIATAVLTCRSGMRTRRGNDKNREAKEETWLFFEGPDTDAKERIARELARQVFGSERKFVPVSLSTFPSSTTRADSVEECSRNKRARDEQSCSSYVERFAEEVSRDSHGVFFVDGIERADYSSQMAIKKATETGRVINSNGDEISLSDAIIILSCERFRSRSRACPPSVKQKVEDEINTQSVSLDLNISIDDGRVDDDDDDLCVDKIGLLASVDRCITF
ncbi:hypothetical protein Nepgr_028209 [Nepenthes gracilis]|uniref:Clp R domain-containing protein n=1 Tax=Nepenthes gracilis TaxID=150966 RepID=A0AAD3TC10_NEPGR|nr:hypothetical protein Nepgr_028209 [Nepenthes gracilis]